MKHTVLILFASALFAAGAAATAGQPPLLQKITADDGGPDDSFGYALAAADDALIVGAWQDDELRLNSGAAYVFDRTAAGNDRSQIVKLLPDNADFAGDEFGRAVDFDGSRIIVGARFDDDLATDRGAAYIFERGAGAGDAWVQTAKLTSADVGFRDEFGRAVAISGNRAVIGADNGSVYVFERDPNSGVWAQTTPLTADDGDSGDDFGQTVDIDGDTVVVGASEHDSRGVSGTGAAYVFRRSSASGVWNQVDKLVADDRDERDRFGFAVAILGSRVLIGAPFDDDSENVGGSAYVFERDAGVETFSQITKLTGDDPTLGDQFGHSVALAGERALVGAINDDERGDDAGAAYLFGHGGGGVWSLTAKLTADDGADDDEFGFAVALSDEEAVVGAPNADNDAAGGSGNDDSGSVYVFGLPSDRIFGDHFES